MPSSDKHAQLHQQLRDELLAFMQDSSTQTNQTHFFTLPQNHYINPDHNFNLAILCQRLKDNYSELNAIFCKRGSPEAGANHKSAASRLLIKIFRDLGFKGKIDLRRLFRCSEEEFKKRLDGLLDSYYHQWLRHLDDEIQRQRVFACLGIPADAALENALEKINAIELFYQQPEQVPAQACAGAEETKGTGDHHEEEPTDHSKLAAPSKTPRIRARLAAAYIHYHYQSKPTPPSADAAAAIAQVDSLTREQDKLTWLNAHREFALCYFRNKAPLPPEDAILFYQLDDAICDYILSDATVREKICACQTKCQLQFTLSDPEKQKYREFTTSLNEINNYLKDREASSKKKEHLKELKKFLIDNDFTEEAVNKWLSADYPNFAELFKVTIGESQARNTLLTITDRINPDLTKRIKALAIIDTYLAKKPNQYKRDAFTELKQIILTQGLSRDTLTNWYTRYDEATLFRVQIGTQERSRAKHTYNELKTLFASTQPTAAATQQRDAAETEGGEEVAASSIPSSFAHLGPMARVHAAQRARRLQLRLNMTHLAQSPAQVTGPTGPEITPGKEDEKEKSDAGADADAGAGAGAGAGADAGEPGAEIKPGAGGEGKEPTPEHQPYSEAEYQQDLIRRALKKAQDFVADGQSNQLRFDLNGRLLITVKDRNGKAVFCRIDVELNEVLHQELMKKFADASSTPAEAGGAAGGGAAETKPEGKIADDTDYRALIPLAEELEMHAKQHLRIFLKCLEAIKAKSKDPREQQTIDLKIQDLKKALPRILEESNKRAWQKFKEIKAALPPRPDIAQINQALDQARPRLAASMREFIYISVRQHIGIESYNDAVRYIREHDLIVKTTATGLDTFEVDLTNRMTTFITGTDATAHNKIIGVHSNAMALRVIKRHRLTSGEQVTVEPNPHHKFSARVPSLAAKVSSHRRAVEDIVAKFDKIYRTRDRSGAATEPLIYNLLTSLQSKGQDFLYGKQQRLSASRILKASHAFNHQLLGWNNPHAFCYVQNISVTRWGDELSYQSSNKTTIEATLMADLSFLHTLSQSAHLLTPDAAIKVRAMYRKAHAAYVQFLSEAEGKEAYYDRYFHQSLSGKALITEMKKWRKEMQDITYIYKPKATLSITQLATLALSRLYISGEYAKKGNGMLVQSLSVFAERSNIFGCKSANERAASVAARVRCLEALEIAQQAESLNVDQNQLCDKLIEFIKYPSSQNLSAFGSQLDTIMLRDHYYHDFYSVSLEDQGGPPKFQQRDPSRGKLNGTNHQETAAVHNQGSSKTQAHKVAEKAAPKIFHGTLIDDLLAHAKALLPPRLAIEFHNFGRVPNQQSVGIYSTGSHYSRGSSAFFQLTLHNQYTQLQAAITQLPDQDVRLFAEAALSYKYFQSQRRTATNTLQLKALETIMLLQFMPLEKAFMTICSENRIGYPNNSKLELLINLLLDCHKKHGKLIPSKEMAAKHTDYRLIQASSANVDILLLKAKSKLPELLIQNLLQFPNPDDTRDLNKAYHQLQEDITQLPDHDVRLFAEAALHYKILQYRASDGAQLGTRFDDPCCANPDIPLIILETIMLSTYNSAPDAIETIISHYFPEGHDVYQIFPRNIEHSDKHRYLKKALQVMSEAYLGCFISQGADDTTNFKSELRKIIQNSHLDVEVRNFVQQQFPPTRSITLRG